MSGSLLKCHDHPWRRLRAFCAACHRPLCDECRRLYRDFAWCGDCLPGSPGRPGPVAPPAPLPREPPEPLWTRARLPEEPAFEEPAPLPPLGEPDLEAEPAIRAPAPPPPPPPPPRPRRRPSRAVLGLLFLQLLTLGAALYLGQRLVRLARPRIAAPLPLPTPRLDIAPGATLGPGSRLTGSAPRAEVATLVVDGEPWRAALVLADRFDFGDLDLPPGRHEVLVIAHGTGGAPGESARVAIRWEVPRPAPAPVTPPPEAYGPPEPGIARSPAPAPSPLLARPSPSPRPAIATLLTPTPAPSPALPVTPRRLPRNILRGTGDGHIALTFDGGSEATQASGILDALKAKGVRSTIFLTGEFIRANPALARRIVLDGHEVGNHSFHHPHLATWVPGRGHVTRAGMTRDTLLEELRRTRELFERTTGAHMSRWWRAPYGEVNDQILGWAASDGWVHVGWTEGLDTLDWVADPEDQRYRSAAEIRDRLLRLAREDRRTRGGIVLMHLGGERDGDQPAEELPRIIDGLRGAGLRLVTVSALLGHGP